MTMFPIRLVTSSPAKAYAKKHFQVLPFAKVLFGYVMSKLIYWIFHLLT